MYETRVKTWLLLALLVFLAVLTVRHSVETGEHVETFIQSKRKTKKKSVRSVKKPKKKPTPASTKQLAASTPADALAARDVFPVRALFRIVRRSDGHVLRARGDAVAFAPKSDPAAELWENVRGALLLVSAGKYATYNTSARAVVLRDAPPTDAHWRMTPTGNVLWVQGGRAICALSVSVSCTPGEHYLDMENTLIAGETPLYRARLSFPARNQGQSSRRISSRQQWSRRVRAGEAFAGVRVRVLAPSKTITFKTNVRRDRIALTATARAPGIAWVFVYGARVRVPAAPTPQNFAIQYHREYPTLVKHVAEKTATEYGIHDRRADKVYRCRDVLMSPYHIKRFQRENT